MLIEFHCVDSQQTFVGLSKGLSLTRSTHTVTYDARVCVCLMMKREPCYCRQIASLWCVESVLTFWQASAACWLMENTFPYLNSNVQNKTSCACREEEAVDDSRACLQFAIFACKKLHFTDSS